MSVLNAARYAQRTGRTLALDLRNLINLPDPPADSFFRNFTIEGFDTDSIVMAPAALADLYRNESRQVVSHWKRIADCDEFDARVVLVPFSALPKMPAGAEGDVAGRMRIGLAGELNAAVETEHARIPEGQRLIGLHYRHGNGEFLHHRMDAHKSSDFDAWTEAVKGRYVAAVNALREAHPNVPTAVYIASDNATVAKSLTRRIAGAITATGTRADIDHNQLAAAPDLRWPELVVAAADLWALSRADWIISGPSLFPDFAASNSARSKPPERILIAGTDISEVCDINPLDTALEASRILQARAPRNPHFARIYAELLEAAGRQDEAERLWARRSLSLRELTSPYYHIGLEEILLEIGDMAGAITSARRAVQADPDVPWFRHRLALLLDRDGEHTEALVHHTAACAAEPDRADFWMALGDTHRRAGRLPAAVAAYEKTWRAEQSRIAGFGEVAHADREPEPGLVLHRWATTLLEDGRRGAALEPLQLICARPDATPGEVQALALTALQSGRLVLAAASFWRLSIGGRFGLADRPG